MGLLDGKVAAITGAGGGIGRAHALSFAREGAAVVVNDYGKDRSGAGSGSPTADQVAAEIRELGGRAVANAADIGDTDGANSVVADAIEHFGKLDIMVNNAGILRDKTLHKMTDDMFDEVIRVHLRGTFLCTRAAAVHMRERGDGGRIINTSSVSGLRGNFGQANYAAAKAGIFGLTITAALELRKVNVTVNALAPIAHTRMTEDLPMMAASSDAATLLSPEHIAPAALFLASDLAADITGQVIGVEGKRLFLWKMTQTEPLSADAPDGWTATTIAERWRAIESGVR